jgi:RHS repeat-associated protein
VQDSAGNILRSSGYNDRGMLTSRTDMDMGTWSFTPNALGETVSQTNAKSQTTTFEFDLLGRLKKRTEAEGISEWTWGTSSAAKNIGRLNSISGIGYSESYFYDSIGRPSNTSILADGTTYQINYSYNTIGALDTLTYPTSTSSYRLKLQYEYQNGYLHRIKDFNAPLTIFWTGNALNARNQITQETLGNGNGLVSNRGYDAVTGWLETIKTGPGAGTGVQNLEYAWDKVGNLTSRKDLNQSGLTETFSYDNLYRVIGATLNTGPSVTYAYDARGNITSKSDVGTYTYHATKKHQVVSTGAPTNWTFGYDANGNMTSGRGATIDWTSYNYPSCIRMGAACAGTSSDYSSFSYTPDRQYWRQVSNYTTGGTATTIYVGGLLEKVTKGADIDYRHMIRAGGSTIIVSRQSSGTNSVNYVTSDHLGGSSAITNSSGIILVNSSFDAFGKRRGSNWTGNPSAGDWTAIASTTRRGYTEHTMLDNLNLTHMNGRVYDQMLGRFASADPYITEPLNTQNYNRYSYVYNRPLSFTDPSGFEGNSFWFGSFFGGGGGAPDWFYRLNYEAMNERPDPGSNSDAPAPPPIPPTSLPSDSWAGTGAQTNPYCDMSPVGCSTDAVPYRCADGTPFCQTMGQTRYRPPMPRFPLVALPEPGERELVVIVNTNGVGHAGVWVGEAGLYDPAGSYASTRAAQDPDFANGSLRDYVRFQLGDGPSVRLYRFQLSDAEYDALSPIVVDQFAHSPFMCAAVCSGIIKNLEKFDSVSGGFRSPVGLGNDLGDLTRGPGAIGVCQYADSSPCRD